MATCLRRSGGALGFGQVVSAGIANDAVGNTQLRNGSGCSVVGRSVNSSGDLADINAAADGHVLRRAASVVGFGALDLADTDAVTGVLPSGNGGTGGATIPTIPVPIARRHGGDHRRRCATSLDVFSKGEIQGGVKMTRLDLANNAPLYGATVAAVARSLIKRHRR